MTEAAAEAEQECMRQAAEAAEEVAAEAVVATLHPEGSLCEHGPNGEEPMGSTPLRIGQTYIVARTGKHSDKHSDKTRIEVPGYCRSISRNGIVEIRPLNAQSPHKIRVTKIPGDKPLSVDGALINNGESKVLEGDALLMLGDGHVFKLTRQQPSSRTQLAASSSYSAGGLAGVSPVPVRALSPEDEEG